MDGHEIERLLTQPESERLERKASVSDRDKLRQTICAFANDLAGRGELAHLVLGVADDGSPSGLAVNDKLLQQLTMFRDDGKIQPLPQLHVEAIPWQGQQVAVVTVWPAASLPVRCDGVAWVRVGPTVRRATREEERRLTERQIASTLPFDRRPCRAAQLDDLDLVAFQTEYLVRAIAPEVLRENDRPPEYQLASLRLFDLRHHMPTHAGVLGFAKQPRDFLPGAYLQFVRYDGYDRASRVLDHKEISGRLREQILQIDALLPVQIQTARWATSSIVHEDRPDYPRFALREFVMNALMHRTYEDTSAPVRIYWFADRVEVLSPGGLYGQVTPANYERESDYRNSVVAELLKTLGAVERFGSGIARAQAALAANGSPPAAFQFEPTSVLVTIRRLPRPIAAAAKHLLHPSDTVPCVEPGEATSADSPLAEEDTQAEDEGSVPPMRHQEAGTS